MGGFVHIRRSTAHRSECDLVKTDRELVDDDRAAIASGRPCPECVAAFEKRTHEWHAALARTVRPLGWNRGKK